MKARGCCLNTRGAALIQGVVHKYNSVICRTDEAANKTCGLSTSAATRRTNVEEMPKFIYGYIHTVSL